MSFLSKLFKKNTPETTEETTKGSVEEFVSLIRVYYQAVMAVNLGVTNLNMLADMALFKRMLKIPTQNNKLGVAEKARVRKVLMQDYGLNETFFKEIDSSVRRCCKTQNDIKTYFSKVHVYSKEGCRSCWAKFFCSGGCNANSFIYEGDVKKPYKIACEMQKKRLECAIALAADRAVKGHEAPSMSEAPASMG